MLGFCDVVILLAIPLAHLAWEQPQPALPSSAARRLADGLDDEAPYQTPYLRGQDPSFGGQEQSTGERTPGVPWFVKTSHGDDPDDTVEQRVPYTHSHRGELTEEEHRRVKAVVKHVALALQAMFPVVIAFTCFYKAWVTDSRPVWPEEGSLMYRRANKFSIDAFQCCDDTDTCLHGFCCTLARFADTVHATGFMNFWAVLAVIVLVRTVAAVVTGLLTHYTSHAVWLYWLASAAIMVYFRQQVRQKLSGGTVCAFHDMNSLVDDSALWCCCGSCATVQEAQEVDQATGLKVECCCRFKAASQPFGPGIMPGAPMATQGAPLAAPASNLVGEAVCVEGVKGL